MYEEFSKPINIDPTKEAFLRTRPKMPAMPKELPIKALLFSKRSAAFGNKLQQILEPSLSAKDLIDKIVRTALEIEFGPIFTTNRSFGKMVSVIADSIITNPDLRRQALAIASIYISRKMTVEKTKQ